MAGQDSLVKWFLPMLLLAGCAVGRYADTPEYKLPETRTTAARQLNEALAAGAIGLSEVVADEVLLTWHERHQLTNKHWVLLDRELNLLRVLSVARPKEEGELYELRVEGTGGQVTFEFKQARAAAAAEAAIRRLMKPLTPEERRELAKKYYANMEQLSRRKGESREDISGTTAAGSLRALTGKDYGNDLEAWLKFLTEEWYRMPAGEQR
jgi:hypothetical protein